MRQFERQFFFFSPSAREKNSGTTSPTPGRAHHCSAIPYNNAALQSAGRVPCAAAKNVRHFVDAVERCQTLLQGIGLSTGCRTEEWKEVSVSTKAIVCHRRLGQELCRIKYTTSHDNNTTLLTCFFRFASHPLAVRDEARLRTTPESFCV